MVNKELICRELIKNGHSKENHARVWDVAYRNFRYTNTDMAKAFLRLKEHPRYKTNVTDVEVDLLKKHVPSFLKNLEGESFNLVNMGCCDGTKAKAIIDSLPDSFRFRYCPVSVNEHLVDLSLENIRKLNSSKVADYAPKISPDFKSLDEVSGELRNTKYQRNVLLVLGSLLASFDIHDYLFRVSQAMLPGDILIIGNGIRKGERFTNLETYKHPLINDWLIHLMRGLGFKDDEVGYNVRFANERVEAFYKVNVDKEVELSGKKCVSFRKGDEIIVAYQYKFFENELKEYCERYFDKVELVKDSREEYVLVLCGK